MICYQNLFKQMLREANPNELAQHSVLNHHAPGMTYLCLHRSPKMTVKVYMLEDPKNLNNGLLVHPHTHRYAFSTTVLRGILEHIRFRELPERPNVPRETEFHNRYRYVAETRSCELAGAVRLQQRSMVYVDDVPTSYWVDTDEIHSIRVFENHGPLIFGLMQLGDQANDSFLYHPEGATLHFPEAVAPSPDLFHDLRNRALELIR